MRYRYIGSQVANDPNAGSNEPIPADQTHRTIKSLDELQGEFASALRSCSTGKRLRRWKTALSTLSSDPGFADLGIADPDDREGTFTSNSAAEEIFDSLSSGHKIVLLATARLVQTIDERSLVLIDEPESHLHPPLLSSFVRALSDLLRQRNGVAIIATHSPVVLQEVPKKCVWLFRRTGDLVTATRPSIETFAENVGILTREVFGLEVTQSGYHKLLSAGALNAGYEQVLHDFDGEIGAEGRALLRAMSRAHDANDD